jgi:hypothetical protein
MPITTDPTPNPNALKFTVGRPVGGPVTFTAATAGDDPLATELLGIEGVVSVFMTADFVTLTKAPGSNWDTISPTAIDALERHYG